MALTYPLIFLSTRAAVEKNKDKKSLKQAVLEVLKNEGIAGLYSGLSSSLLGIAVTNFVYYGFYEKSKSVVLRSRPGKGLGTLESILVGMIAGSATSIISNPIWVIQTTQAVRTMEPNPPTSSEAATSDSSVTPQKPRKLGFIESINHILENGGVAAFWRGIGPALALVVNPVIQYTVFEQLKNRLLARRTTRLRAAGSGSAAILTSLDLFFLGSLSKLVATGSTYPYIVIKSRMQAGHAMAKEYKSALGGILKVAREEGIHGLYRGIESKLLQSVLTAAILFVSQQRIYELTKTTLSNVPKVAKHA
ncbi:hypothetical protein M407DRAFT_240810 [Tulasnella calospora MUT 4182]|uniref:Mitochondrial carrier n=1 Tax=Tulasnella calospora MUT 4182 TaxID=1051891 RepID=A0A0C3MJM4_9AGAM|nr:hypothetical protein M407DRAFT_240810 [Tulasnella calospora MUT 4182]